MAAHALAGSFEDRVPLNGTDALGRPSTLTIYRQPAGVGMHPMQDHGSDGSARMLGRSCMHPFIQDHGSAGSARMQSMLDGSSFAPQGPPPAHSAPASLPLGHSAAASLPLAHSTDLPAIMDGSAQMGPSQSAPASGIDGGPSAGSLEGENGNRERTAVSAAELRQKVMAARRVVFSDRQARVSFFSFCYPHQRRRRGYNRAQTHMRWWICSSRCLALIPLISALKAIAVKKKPAAASAAAPAKKLKTVSPPEPN